MKAIRFIEKNKVRLEDIAAPAAAEDRILIETIYSGISWGTETAWLTGKSPFNFPGIPGYLSVGKVLHVGRDTGRDDITAGQTVWAGGPHSQRVNQVPAVVQPLPEGIDLKSACFCHLAAIALHCLNRAGAAAGETLYVAGQGFLGQLTAQAGGILGMNVFAGDLLPERLATSRGHSCDKVFRADDPALRQAILAAGGADVIVNSTGAAGLEDSLIELLATHGRLVAQGMTPRVDFDLYKGLGREISVLLAEDATRQEDVQCIDLILKGKFRVAPLITTELSPGQAVDWYTRSNRDDILGAIIDWSRI
ncbi:MAG: hypothetical protein SVT52_09035 [Planctomycetota bacterium]|nr:hypothetical protein [Planctomycetota bacterium]